MSKRIGLFAGGLFSVLLAGLTPQMATAGCGCDKPPPPPAAIRPNFAYPGATVILFDDRLREGETYEVEFASGTGPAVATTSLPAVSRRDQADGTLKPQLRIQVPTLPLGPTKVTVRTAGENSPGASSTVLLIPDSDFTVIGSPIVVPANSSFIEASGYRTAVDRAGFLYISFDLTNVHAGTVFAGLAVSLPVDLVPGDIAFYNTQGFFMQSLLDPAAVYAVLDTQGDISDALGYWRHEFQTYHDKHLPGGVYAPSAEDPGYWHADGTPHIDHNHIVMAVRASLHDGSSLPAGKTGPFDLYVLTAN